MSKAMNGIKSGLVAGIVYGVLDSVFAILAVIMFKDQVLASLGQYITNYPSLFSNITAMDLYNLSIALIPMIAIIGGILLGLVFGAIFGYAYDRIPGRIPSLKGILFGLILWVVLNVLIGLLDVTEFGWYYYLAGIAGGLVATVAYGYILGTLYGYLVGGRKPRLQPQ